MPGAGPVTGARIDWGAVLALGAGHVQAERASLGMPPTLRRVHYLLVSDEAATVAGYANTVGAYKGLSRETARAREAGTFPSLTDRTRSVVRPQAWQSEREARDWLADAFALDRRPYCARRVLVGVEKDGIVPLVRSRFGWLDVSAVRGYASLTHARTLSRYDVIVYAGDFDPTGLDIDRDLAERAGVLVDRVALTEAQVAEHRLPPAPAKSADSRTAAMLAEHGVAVQVEVDALPGAVLLDAIGGAVAGWTGLEVDADGWPVLPEVDAEEAGARDRLRGAS